MECHWRKRAYESLYVHVPFCSTKCDYCAFYSVPAVDSHTKVAYLRRLSDEFALHAGDCDELTSVFVGGGTPSHLDMEQLGSLLGAVGTHFHLSPGCEFTLECNPDSLSGAKVAILPSHGVTRVSLGVQSFSSRHRETLGRRGDVAGLPAVLSSLRRAGIDAINLDLIYAIPGQSLADWRRDLCQATELGVPHLSTYALTVEEGTVLGAAHLPAVDEDATVEMWHEADAVATTAGLCRYEVSNFARPGAECRHNDRVWHGGTYLGSGPSACSFDGQIRRTNPRDLHHWIAGAPAEFDELPEEARAAEILAFGMRTVRGWDSADFLDRTGIRYRELRGPELARLAEEGLVGFAGPRVYPTEQGLLFADLVAERLL